MVQFIKRTMSFEVVQGIVSVATDSDLTHAHRRWRSILSLAQRIVPEIAAENEFARFLAAGFGRVCSPLIIRWIRDGKTKQLDDSLSEITKFMDGHDLRGILTCGILGKKICEPDIAALSGLVLKLRKIWDYSGFPFSYSAS